MAEKEEFLFVLRVEESDELRNITPYCNGCTFFPCDEECINRKKPITRQEAINRMAKAAGKAYRGYFYAEPNHPNISDMMEAALDALLEER